MTKSTNYRHTFPAAALAEHGRRAILLVGALMLSACGGGGGGGSTVPTTSPTIEIDPTKTVEAMGPGKQASYVWNGGFTEIGAAKDAAASAVFMFDTNDKLAVLTMKSTTATSTTEISFAGDEIKSLGTDFWVAANTSAKAIVSNPLSPAWDYQSFGVWESGLGTPSGYYGAMSVGEASPAAAIPGAYGATFKGTVIGSYVTGGIGRAVLADLTVLFDTGGQSLTFTAERTRYAESGQLTYLPGLDMTGQTLTYIEGTNGFSGTLTTANGLSGNSTGQFYGPNATELGGVFFLRSDPNNSSVETYSGAYGAQQVAP